MNSTPRLHKIQLTVIYSHVILVSVMSKLSVKRVICKNWTMTLADSENPDQTLHCLLKLQEVKD